MKLSRTMLLPKTLLLPILALTAFIISDVRSGHADDATELSVMAFNLRYASPVGENSWPERLNPAAETILEYEPDIIGTQEGFFYQLNQLHEVVADQYDWLGLGREGGSRGEFMAIFYKKERFKIVAYDHIWLSSTPMLMGSKDWGNEIPRMITWIRFRDTDTDQEFYIWNTHFDHRSPEARKKSAELLIQRIREQKPERPVIVLGDFNSVQDSEPHETLLSAHAPDGEIRLIDSWEAAEERNGDQIGTFHGWKGPNDKNTRRIDWVLTSQEIKAESIEVVTYNKDGQYPSDHFPVFAELEIPHDK